MKLLESSDLSVSWHKKSGYDAPVNWGADQLCNADQKSHELCPYFSLGWYHYYYYNASCKNRPHFI